MSGLVLFVGLDILGAGLRFGPRRQGARRRRAGGAPRHQGRGETESTRPFSRDFIVSVVVVVAIAAKIRSRSFCALSQEGDNLKKLLLAVTVVVLVAGPAWT